MNLIVLTFFIAAATTDPATTGSSSTTTNKSSSSAASPTKKNSKSTATITADPNAVADTSVALPKSKKVKASESTPMANEEADPATIVGNSIDAATLIANEAAKAALDEAAKLAALGSDTDKSGTGSSVINSQTAAAVADGAVTVAKELKKPKAKKSSEDTGSTDEVAPKPAKKSKASTTDTAAPSDNPASKN